MHISRFVNNPDGTPIHDSGLVTPGQPSSRGPKSFAQRRAIDRRRQTIGGYKQSLLGTQYVSRGNTSDANQSSPSQPAASGPANRQEVNARGNLNVPPRRFQEPPSRGFNPYD